MDSICSKCAITIASSPWEAELERAEKTHECDPERLRYLYSPDNLISAGKPSQPSPKQRRTAKF